MNEDRALANIDRNNKIESILAKAQLINEKKLAVKASDDYACLELSREHYFYREHHAKLLTGLFQAEEIIADKELLNLKSYIKALLKLIEIIDNCLEERRLFITCIGLQTDRVYKELVDAKEYLYFEILVSENTAEYYRPVEESVLRLQARIKALQERTAKEISDFCIYTMLPAEVTYIINSFPLGVGNQFTEDKNRTSENTKIYRLLLKEKMYSSLGEIQRMLATDGNASKSAIFNEVNSAFTAQGDLLLLEGEKSLEYIRMVYSKGIVPNLDASALKKALFRYFATFFIPRAELYSCIINFDKGEISLNLSKLNLLEETEVLLKGCFELYSNLGHRNSFGAELMHIFSMIPFEEVIIRSLAGMFNILVGERAILEQYLQLCFEKYLEVANEFRNLIFADESTNAGYVEKLKLILENNRKENFLSKQDVSCFETFYSILDSLQSLNSYTSSSHVEEDILQLLKAHKSCSIFIKHSLGMPTAFFLTALYKRILQLEEYLTTEIKRTFLYINPRLAVKIKDYEIASNNKSTTLFLELTNAKGMQRAEKLKLLGLRLDGLELASNYTVGELTDVPGDGKEYELELMLPYNIQTYRNMEIMLGYSYVCGYQEYEARNVYREMVFEINIPQKTACFKEIPNLYAPICTSNAVVDPNMMFGRTELIEKLVTAVDFNQPKSVVLWGQKRTGKSTVLLHLQNALATKFSAEKALLVPCDAMSKIDIDSCSEHKEVMLEIKKIILKGIRKAVKSNDKLLEMLEGAGCNIKPIVTNKNVNERFEEFFDIYEELEEKPSLVLFIDEFTVLYNWIKQEKLGLSFIKWWREFLSSNKIIAFIVGQDYMQQFIELDPNGFGNVEKYKVNYLTKEYTLDLIEKPLWLKEEGKSRFLDEAAESIYELTAGSAFYTVIICKNLVDYLNSKKLTYVTDYMIGEVVYGLIHGEQALSQDIFEALYNDEGCFDKPEYSKQCYELCKLMAQFSSTLKKTVSELEIKRVALEKIQLTEQQVNILLENLTKRDVLNKDGSNYTIKVHLFHEWLKVKG